jgi:nicotinamidase-related amidase
MPHSTATKDVMMKLRNGLASLLRPEDSVLVLIDHQPYQLANVNSHEPQMVINNTAALANCVFAEFADRLLPARIPCASRESDQWTPRV